LTARFKKARVVFQLKALLISVCDKLPGWVKDGFTDYQSRLKQSVPLEVLDLSLGQRGKNADLKRALADEGQRMLRAIPKNSRVIALDSDGASWSSEQLAQQLSQWQQEGRDLCFLIGGPDGLDQSCLQAAQLKLSFGAMTLPHALVRIVLAEQLFRAVCLLSNHPYHRAGKIV